MKKKIPAGNEGAGMRALKKSSPQVAARMGYKQGGKVGYMDGGKVKGYRNGGAVMAGKNPRPCNMS
jgi:hypothetical protein|tara:strand:- start:208 stop:405 length:198 start_codon:yes stop_codon:yes gene_type:complete